MVGSGSVRSVGRPTAELEARLKGLPLRRSSVLLGVWGEAGVGKTHTVSALLNSLGVQSFSFHATTGPQRLAAALPAARGLPPWAEGALSKVRQGQALEPALLQQAVAALLNQMAPVVLHLEDIHEADPTQLEWIVGLAALLKRSKGVGMIASSRTPPPEVFEPYRLEPLDSEQTGALLEGEMGAALPAEAARWIFGKTQGNPMFSLEYLRYLARQGFTWNDGQRWHWRSPPEGLLPLSVEALLERQLLGAASEPAAQAALEAAAMLGRLGSGADRALWRAVAEVSEGQLEQAEGILENAGVLRGGAFSHPLLGEVALRAVPPARQAELARRAIAHLEADAPQQAVLFLDEAQLLPARALELLAKAAQSAAQPRQRGLLLARAAGQAEGTAQGRLALEAAQLLQGHSLDKALEMGQLALGQPETAQQAVELVGLLLARSGDLEGLERHLRQHPTDLSPEVLRLRAYQLAGQHAKVVELWQAHPRLHGSADPDLLYAAALAHLATGRLPGFEALLTQAMSLPLSPQSRLNFVGIRAMSQLDRGEYTSVVEGLRAVIAGLRAGGDRHKLGAMLHNLSIAHKALLEYPQAQQALGESLEIRREMGDIRPYANSLALMAELEAELGLQAEAEAKVEEALGILQLYPASPFYANTLSQASYIHGLAQTPLAALLQMKYAARALTAARELGNERLIHELLYDYALAQARNAAPRQALDTVAEMRQRASGLGDPVGYRWRARQVEALALEALGRAEEARAAFGEALELAESVPDRLNAQKLGLELDRLSGDAASARRRLEWFEARGLKAGAALALRHFPALAQQGNSPTGVGAEVRLEVLGPMQVSARGGREAVRGQKRKELLLTLLEARMGGRAEVSTLDLLEALYPGESELEAQTALKQLVFKIRAAYGQSFIQTTPSGYALGGVDSDAEAFLRGGETGLWRGAYGEGFEGQESVREALYGSLRRSTEALLPSDPQQASALCQLLLQADPYDVAALRLLCRSLQGNPKALVREYAKARGRFLEVGERLPEQPAAFLA
ncbi:MAG: hypothetical protein SFU83_11110 [Meiothermus sp.]|nr:hypothetical protein [Meiothermus sp.]